MASKMELPIELVRIVNDYSKPVLKHFKKYNEVLREKEIVEWPELKQKLLEPNVEPVLKAMDEYLKASALYNNASREFDDLPFSEDEEDWTVEEAKVARPYLKNCDYLFCRALASSRNLNRLVSV
jgi:hypothetical protein